MIQCDNGREFMGAVTTLLESQGILFVNGRARHPQSQGLVEKGNGTVKSIISSWEIQNKRTDWPNALEFAMCAINTSPCEGLPRSLTPNSAVCGHERRLYDDNLGLIRICLMLSSVIIMPWGMINVCHMMTSKRKSIVCLTGQKKLTCLMISCL